MFVPLMIIETPIAINSSINIFKIHNMKRKKSELDVDFIGGQGPLTPAEEKALSEFIRQHKLSSKKIKKEHQSKAAGSKKKN